MTAQIKIYFQLLSQLAPVEATKFYSRADLKKLQQQAIQNYRDHILAQQLDVQPETLHFSKTEYGKPFLSHFPSLAFNHSHGRAHYALALSHQVCELGIDVESLARKVRFDALAQHAFHEDEYLAWKATGENPIFWFQVWTAKEAILKACGLGIRMNLNELNTNVIFGQEQGRCQHALLGNFSYVQMQKAGAMITVAWKDQGNVLPELIFID